MDRYLAGEAGVLQAIDAVIEEALEDGRVVGAVVLVWDHGTALYARAAGYADRETGVPVHSTASSAGPR